MLVDPVLVTVEADETASQLALAVQLVYVTVGMVTAVDAPDHCMYHTK